MAPSLSKAPGCPLPAPQLTALDAALRGLSPTQLAWVSGYLAGLAQAGAPATSESPPGAPARDPTPTVTILHGSQTGNAKAVAERLGVSAGERGLAVRTLSMADLSPRRLAKESLVLMVVSTHGEGEPPETAYALHQFLLAADAPRLPGLRYAVLGLGDSSYEHFCRTAVEFDRRLAELGAERLLPLQCCDLDYQPVCERWTDDALSRLTVVIGRRDDARPASGTATWSRPNGESANPTGPAAGPPNDLAASRDHPLPATLLENRRITTPEAVADVRHLALGIDPERLTWQPGDALGVWFRNDPGLVDAVLAETRLDGAAAVTLDGRDCDLRTALSDHLELTLLHPTTARAWLTLDGTEPPAAAELRTWAAARQFIDLLVAHPRRTDADGLVRLLRPLTPRLYSIASSQVATEDEVHLTVSVVRWQGHGRDHLGGASGFLAGRLGSGGEVPVYVAPNEAFRLPADDSTPIVMIGAGTGVAPYRAFLQQRAATGGTGRNWLIFGNRHFHRDFLYQLDWQAFRKAGLLERVSLAFSRDGAGDRPYVQQRVREAGRELLDWLEAGAHLYVCGGTAMGAAVQQALLDLLTAEAGLTPADAADRLDRLRREARYHRDLY